MNLNKCQRDPREELLGQQVEPEPDPLHEQRRPEDRVGNRGESPLLARVFISEVRRSPVADPFALVKRASRGIEDELAVVAPTVRVRLIRIDRRRVHECLEHRELL
jgi:hypothetical protein